MNEKEAYKELGIRRKRKLTLLEFIILYCVVIGFSMIGVMLIW